MPFGSPVVPDEYEHPQRMGERNGVKIQRGRLGDQFGPPHCSGQLRTIVEVRQQNSACERRHLVTQRSYAISDVEGLPAVPISIDGQEHRRLQLREAVAYGASSKIR